MSNGAVMFRMVSMFREDMAQCDDINNAEWIVNASYKRSRQGKSVTAKLTAENITTHELLTFPQDSDRIITVMPREFWPQFVLDLPGPVASTQLTLV